MISKSELIANPMVPNPDGHRRYVTSRVHAGAIWSSMIGLASLARWGILGGLVILNLFGCNSLQKKHDNPVMIEAPRRTSMVQPEPETKVAENESTKPAGGIIPASGEDKPKDGSKLKLDLWDTWEDDTAIYNAQVAAKVNGAPILNGDVLDRYSDYLIKMRETMQQKKVPPSEYEKVREMFVQRDLQGHIQRRLLVESMRSTLKPEQVKALNAHLDNMFEREIEKLKREMKVSTKTELELELNKKGTTLQNVKDTFTTERMAMEYVALKMEKAEHIDRLDLLEYYKSHADDFAVPANVTWDQIQVSFTDSSSKAEAQKKINEALQELSSGAPFDVVARKYSDALSAKQGGHCDPMEEGSLTDTKLEKMLFSMPRDTLSKIYEGPTEFQIVRVVARQEAGRKELGDVQDEIRQKLETEQNKKRPEKLFKSLFADAVIETKYDHLMEQADAKSP
ncbi:MAG: peptidylprolyl isomerase [Planctomycetes bacterium]|nr:peptidylprolyl isomerase [Planctomycetota bacterium]